MPEPVFKFEPSQSEEAAPASERREKRRTHEIFLDGCFANIQKGGDAKAMIEDSEKKHILVCDTGQPYPPPEDMRHPKTQEDLDEIYRWTIRQGIVDHHSIDSAVRDLPAGLERRCSAKMIADFPEEVFAQIRKRGITDVAAHIDSDLDSVTATYLSKHLIETGRLPHIAEAVGNHVNLVDYGGYREIDPENYIQSLAGMFSSLKKEILDRQYAELGPIFALPANTEEERAEKGKKIGLTFAKYGKLLLDSSIHLLNSIERLSADKPVDLTKLSIQELMLDDTTLAILLAGRAKVKVEYEKFDQLFDQAEKTEAAMQTKEGRIIKIPLIIFSEPDMNPLAVTNMTYMRSSPETVVAVYAGPDRRHGGDAYDIGMKPETTDLFDLKFLEAPLNKAEADKRKARQAELEQKEQHGTITPEEAVILKKWRSLRQGFEYLGHGDPTVCVAGGSLIAASTTSLLSPEDFRLLLSEVFQ